MATGKARGGVRYRTFSEQRRVSIAATDLDIKLECSSQPTLFTTGK